MRRAVETPKRIRTGSKISTKGGFTPITIRIGKTRGRLSLRCPRKLILSKRVGRAEGFWNRTFQTQEAWKIRLEGVKIPFGDSKTGVFRG